MAGGRATAHRPLWASPTAAHGRWRLAMLVSAHWPWGGGQGARAEGQRKRRAHINFEIFFLAKTKRVPHNCVMDQTTLKTYLHYDPDTGVFTALKPCGKRPAGRVLGSLTRHGYVQISVASRSYTAQRLAWLYAYGSWPDGVVDHINRVRNDNRLSNLRCVSYSHNALNTEYTRSKFKTRGVTYCPPWKASIQVNGKRKEIGRFHTFEEAVTARKAAEQQFKV